MIPQETVYVEDLAVMIDAPKDPNPVRRNCEPVAAISVRTQKMYERAFSLMEIVQRIIDIARTSSVLSCCEMLSSRSRAKFSDWIPRRAQLRSTPVASPGSLLHQAGQECVLKTLWLA